MLDESSLVFVSHISSEQRLMSLRNKFLNKSLLITITNILGLHEMEYTFHYRKIVTNKNTFLQVKE